MQRIRSLDILRGAIMVLMAIDHVRVYSGMPAGGPEPGIFFTRWITHFCAPGFAFLAGTGAFLYGQKLKNRNALSRYLFTRGLLLVILELTLIRFEWTFNLHFSQFMLAGVIWMLGWCMVIMSLLVRMKAPVVAYTGIAMIAFQQVFRYVPALFPSSMQETAGKVWSFFYPCGFQPAGIAVLYVLIPWVGVMAAGYGFGSIALMEPLKRKRICLTTGFSCMALFAVIASVIAMRNASGEPSPFIFRLLNQQKYPPSQLFLLMTLGPLIALVPFAEKTKGWFAGALSLFGRVPFFYYLWHILIIHISALAVNFMLYDSFHQEWYTTAPFAGVPEDRRWGLFLLYIVYFIDLTLLYFLCRWYAGYKSGHAEKKWLKYI